MNRQSILETGYGTGLGGRVDDVSVPAAATGTAAHTLNIKAKGGYPETLSSEASWCHSSMSLPQRR